MSRSYTSCARAVSAAPLIRRRIARSLSRTTPTLTLLLGTNLLAESRASTTSLGPAVNGPTLAHIVPSDNRRPAGRLEGNVLTVRLEARPGMWYPEGPRGLGLPVAAFAEEGKAAQNPGPLVRVRVGAEVRAFVRNSLTKPVRTSSRFSPRTNWAPATSRISARRCRTCALCRRAAWIW